MEYNFRKSISVEYNTDRSVFLLALVIAQKLLPRLTENEQLLAVNRLGTRKITLDNVVRMMFDYSGTDRPERQISPNSRLGLMRGNKYVSIP
jgi:hypothetical protein